MDSEDNNTIHLTTSSRSKRFIPTCSICGNQHWPRDPSCLGKKGAKAKAKAKASGKAKARAKRLGPADTNTYQPATVAQVKPLQPDQPAMPSVSVQPAQSTQPVQQTPFVQPGQPVNSPVFPPRENTDIQPQPKQQQGGKTVVKIKAKSHREITSFDDEIIRIKRQADEVVLRASEDAAHRVQSERTARLNAEEKARNEAAARLKAEQRLNNQAVKLKALQDEARQAAQSNTNKAQQFQQQFTEQAPPIQPPAPPVSQPNTTSLRVAPSYTNSNVGTLLAIRARDIMETNITWAGPEETISTVLDRMLTDNSHYAIVIANGNTEGIVSRSELTGPISENLKPFIAKWQRPGTDATFNIAVKWIMSRQLNSITSQDTCTAIMKKMRALNMCPLPVVEDGETIGLVTPFNVFKIRALLKLESDNSSSSNRQLIQTLPAKISSYLSELNATNKTNQTKAWSASDTMTQQKQKTSTQ